YGTPEGSFYSATLGRIGALVFLSSALRQAVNIGSKQVHLIVAEEGFLGRHVTITAVAQGLRDLREAGTVQPGAVGQVRCAQHLQSLGIRTMTDYAIGLEDLLTCGKVNVKAFRIFQARQAAYITCSVADAVFAN